MVLHLTFSECFVNIVFKLEFGNVMIILKQQSSNFGWKHKETMQKHLNACVNIGEIFDILNIM